MQDARCKTQISNPQSQILKVIVWLVVAVASLLMVGTVVAQGGTVTDDQVNTVAKRLNCPVCENVPLDVCETQACVQWRDLIRQKLAAGEKPEQIINYFQATYGDRVLQEPPRQGFTGLVWILPFVGLVAGVAILAVVLRRMTAQPAPVQLETMPSESADEYRERLERELKELG
jgi:cytochrome c-type biogenesis protein CcmH